MLKVVDAEIKSLQNLQDKLEGNKSEKEKANVMTSMKDTVKSSKKQLTVAKDDLKQFT